MKWFRVKETIPFFIILELYVSVLQVFNQNETPLLYSLVFGEGVVNDATSVVLFQAVQTYNFDNFTPLEGFQIGGSFLYLFFLSCILGIMVSIFRPPIQCDSVSWFSSQLHLFF